MNVIVSIGRNAPDGRILSDHSWAQFIRATRYYLSGNVSEIVFDGSGTGRYEGKTEESHTFIGILPAASSLGIPWHLDNLREWLAKLAVTYLQTSIAMTVCEPEFVSAAPDRGFAG